MAKNNFHDYSINQGLSKYDNTNWVVQYKSYRKILYDISIHYHPFVDELIQQLNMNGLLSLFNPIFLEDLNFDLSKYYTKSAWDSSFPVENIDVSDDGSYSIYNWELFFHAPLAVACHLSKNQRFEEAQHWFHLIFDPTSKDYNTPVPQRFWNFLRFREETDPQFIQQMLVKLSDSEDSDVKTRLEKSIQAWRNNPFQPHVVARGRYLAYQMNVVMKYLDNLIAWGDNLFMQDTIESLNEATQVYVLAANLLGPKPEKVPPRGKKAPMTYAQLKAVGIDDFGNALVDMENDFPFNTLPTSSNQADEDAVSAVFGIGRSLYFCVPQNDMLLTYWDTVADRLFKIRHCMNFEGVVRQLALFDPPLDPGMLVKAAAAGIDISSIINNINQPLSIVRGHLLLQKAQEICSEVKALGGALLSAIEKGENEHIALLRQQNELKLLTMVQDVKFLQWKDAEASTEALLKTRATVFERFKHYKLILGNNASDIDTLKTITLDRKDITESTFDGIYNDLVSKYAVDIKLEAYRAETSVGGLMEFAGNAVTSAVGGQLGKTLPLNKNENAELNIFLPTSDFFNTISSALGLATPILGLIPQFDAHATPIGVGAKVGFGGVQLSKFAKEGSKIIKDVANAFASSAERASKMATYYRRAEDYVLQANLAASDLMQYGRQIISSLIKEQLTKKEYENHLKQIEQVQTLEDFMTNKFSQEELYVWMQGELSKLYFDCYKFAFDIAKRAEQTMKYELMRKEFDDLDIIKFGYWDSARKGLLAGESLALDLKRLEMAYHDHNSREYEITKHISLHRLDPMALLKLKATGICEINIPEWVYDMDNPGQYMRRIKSVALSIPCVTGPYTGVHCKLSLMRSSIRTSSLLGDGYERALTGDDSRFRDFNGTIQSIVTSTAQNDSGLFELNLRDERFLPFEGAGAISSWKIELPNQVPQFDFESISDVILHIRYTSREAGQLKSDSVKYLNENVLQTPGLIQLFCLNYDFTTSWYVFQKAANDSVRKLYISVMKEQFPYWVNPLGMSGALKATFCCIDWKKNKLTLATTVLNFVGDQDAGWTLSVDNNSGVFAFLKKNINNKVYMAVSFAEAV